ncbi:MAG: 30S ribosomal protein S15 [Candidatus Micrarchaeia archaeon]
MAKMHSKKRGRSKSRKPRIIQKTQEDYTDAQIKEKIIELAKKGTKPAEIGRILRDEYAVGDIRAHLGGKRLSSFLKDEDVYSEYPPDLLDLIRKAVGVRNHLKNNKTDRHNKVKLSHMESKIKRLTIYYIKEGKLSSNWKYDPQTAHLLLK